MGPSSINVAGFRSTSVSRRQNMKIENGNLKITWERSPLIELLRESVFSQSTDPRDRVFALLGVSHDACEEELKPNCNETPDYIFFSA